MDTTIKTVQRPNRSMGQRLQFMFAKYLAVFRVSIASNLAYAMEVVFRALMLIAIVFILSQLWKTTFELHGAKILNGFTIADMVWYLVAAEAIAMSMPALTRRIDEEVRSGQLAYLLGRPCNYVFYNYAQYLGERLVRFLLNSIVGIILALIVVGLPHITLPGLLAWPLVVVLAMSIDFVAYFCIGLLAFWTEETQSFAFVFSRMTLVLGGVLAPLEIFPQPLRSIAQALPFSTILYGPAHTLVHFAWSFFGALLIQQVVTLLVGGGLLSILYRVAIRRVNMNGG